MTELNDLDDTGHSVAVRKAGPDVFYSCLPMGGFLMGDDRIPVEIASQSANGSIVVVIGHEVKRYYIVHTADIVSAAYQADCAMREKEATKEVKS